MLVNVWNADVLDHIIQQLSNDMLEELVAHITATQKVETHAMTLLEEDFLPHNK